MENMKTSAACRLAELRRKTDRELLALVKPELNRARIMASVVATKESPSYEQANKIVERMAILLPTIDGVDQNQREALESTIKEVRLALDHVPEHRVQVHTYSTVAS